MYRLTILLFLVEIPVGSALVSTVEQVLDLCIYRLC